MKTYTELKAKIKAPNNDAATHRAAAADARRQADSFRTMRAEAIANEDMAAYADACQRVEFYEQRAALEDKRAAANTGAPVAEYVDAWEEYARDYNKDFAKKWASFCKLRNEMAAAWLELMRTVAEGNGEAQQIREDLAGRRVGTMDIVETITKLSRPEATKANAGEVAETAITAAAFQLDYDRRENLRGILEGWNTDGDIYADTVGEYAAKHPTPPRAVFPYPVYMTETEEEETKRKIKGKPQPVGYFLNNGQWKEDPDFYDRMEKQQRKRAAQEAPRI